VVRVVDKGVARVAVVKVVTKAAEQVVAWVVAKVAVARAAARAEVAREAAARAVGWVMGSGCKRCPHRWTTCWLRIQ
jgi:hypothetical protein